MGPPVYFLIIMKITNNMLKVGHEKKPKNNDTLKVHTFIETESTVAVQKEDGKLLIYSTITEHSDRGHSRSYKSAIMKLCRIVTRTVGHINAIPLFAKQYLQEQIAKLREQYMCRDDGLQTI